MNIRRLAFWAIFVIVIGLIVWGLAAASKGPAPQSVYGEIAPVSAADHVLGPVDAKVTLVEYSDFQCPACQQYFPIIERLYRESSTTIRLVYRHYPLPQHQNAVPAALASEAAARQDKFWEMYRLIFSRPSEWENEIDATPVFSRYAAELGLDAVKFKSDMNGPAAKAAIDAAKAGAERIFLDHTPSFFVNGKYADNPQSYEALKAIIDTAAR